MDFEHNNSPETVYTSFVTPDKQAEILSRMNELFERSGMTIQQLAKVTYISESALSRYFCGKTKDPHFYTMCTMVIAMGGDINEILGITPPPAESTPPENPYGELLVSYQEEARSLRSALDNLSVSFARSSRWSRISTAILAVVLIGFTAVEIVDLCTPDWGRYQWAVEMFERFLYNV